MSEPTFKPGDWVRKTRGSSWYGRVCGTYSTNLTPEGYCVESSRHPGSVQIYPVGALELWVPYAEMERKMEDALTDFEVLAP